MSAPVKRTRRSPTDPTILKPKLYQYMVREIVAMIQTKCPDPNVYNPLIATFIRENVYLINQQIDTMYKDYEDDGDLQALRNPENDWIRDYIDGELYNNLRNVIGTDA